MTQMITRERLQERIARLELAQKALRSAGHYDVGIDLTWDERFQLEAYRMLLKEIDRDDFINHIRKCAEEVATWPEWKKRGADAIAAITPPVPDICDEDGQSQAVSIKLPDDEDGQPFGFGKWANSKLPATVGTMTLAYCEDGWREAFNVFAAAAGINLEVGE